MSRVLLLLLLVSTVARAQEVGHRVFTVLDESRERTLTVHLWYPAHGGEAREPSWVWEAAPQVEEAPATGRFPLVLLSHGLNGSPESMSWLGQALARGGMAVAAPQHHDPTWEHPHMDHWNRAMDLSFVLTRLLEEPFWQQHLDSERVGMAGFSLGGGTGIWLAGGVASQYRRTVNPGPRWAPPDEFPPVGSPIYRRLLESTDFVQAARSYLDPRIKAFFLMAPSLGWAFEAEDLAGVQRPVFIVVGAADEMLVPQTNALHYARSIPSAQSEVLPAPAGHFVFLSRIRPEAVSEFDPTGELKFLYTDTAGVDRAELQQRAAILARQFFEKELNPGPPPAPVRGSTPPRPGRGPW